MLVGLAEQSPGRGGPGGGATCRMRGMLWGVGAVRGAPGDGRGYCGMMCLPAASMVWLRL